MSSSPNWARLVSQGRAKAYGVPWSDEEVHAVYELGIPAEFVRRGALTRDEYDAMQDADRKHKEKTGKKPVEAMDREELQKEAEEVGIDTTPAATTESLRDVVNAKGGKRSSKEKDHE
jgi:hypothetical protein